MDRREHWERVYSNKAPDAVSWYAPRLERSLEIVESLALAPSARIIDVGGGAATFARDLMVRGFERPTVLDISRAAIEAARGELGAGADRVQWIAGDITRAELPEAHFDLWHDRAVFHFLTDPEDRQRYVEQVLRAVRPGGHVVVATFGPEGPTRCSGLDVVRYSAEGLHSEFGASFAKLSSTTELHETPWGSEQEFLYCLCRVEATGAETQVQSVGEPPGAAR